LQPVDERVSRRAQRSAGEIHVLHCAISSSRRRSCAAAQNFGEIMLQQDKDRRVPGFPQVSGLRPVLVAPASTWSTAKAFTPIILGPPIRQRPPRCTRDAARARGDTQFVNMHAAYDELPEAMKRRLDGFAPCTLTTAV